jgi:hypothetical protein
MEHSNLWEILVSIGDQNDAHPEGESPRMYYFGALLRVNSGKNTSRGRLSSPRPGKTGCSPSIVASHPIATDLSANHNIRRSFGMIPL